MHKFIESALSIGVEISDPVQTTGKDPERVPLTGNGREKDGWYYLNIVNGEYVGVIGNWKTGERIEVKPGGGFEGIPAAELAALQFIRKEAEKELQKVHDQAAMDAKAYVDGLPSCPENHPYLVTKGIKPHGVVFDEEDGALVIPLFDISAKQTSWQKIWDESQPGGKRKRFLKGGQKKGCFYHIEGTRGTIYICEGFATGASINEATGCEVFVAFDAGNLQPAIDSLKTYFSRQERSCTIIVAADNDHAKEKNIGLEKAQDTGEAVVYPDGIDGTDFNDLHTELGLNAVREALFPVKNETIVEVMAANDFEKSSLTTPINDDLWKVGGLIQTGCEGLTAPGLSKVIQYAFPVVCTAIARAVSGKISCQGQWPNLYSIKVGPTSSGKSMADIEFKRALIRADMTSFIGLTDIASGPGLLRAMERNPITLFNIDEATSMFRSTGRYDPVAAGKREALMELFDATGLMIRKMYGAKKDSIDVDCPCLSMVGNTTNLVFDDIKIDDFESGFIPRIDFFCYDGKRDFYETKQPENMKLDTFCAGLKSLMDVMPPGGNLAGLDATRPIDIELTRDATVYLNDISRATVISNNKVLDNNVLVGITSRTYQKTIKYALVHVAGTRPTCDIYRPMEIKDLEWGYKIAGILTRWKQNVLTGKISSGDFHADCLMFMDGIKMAIKKGKRPTFNAIMYRKVKIKNWQMDYSQKVINVLEKRGSIFIDESLTKTAYFLVKETS